MRDDGTVYWLLGDHLGSSNVSYRATDGVTIMQRYAIWGAVRGGGNALPTDYTFTGQRLDSTGLMYYGARFYDPFLARFVQADTIVPQPGNPQSLNRFSYVANNPVRYIDPTGKFTTSELAEWGISKDLMDDWQDFCWEWWTVLMDAKLGDEVVGQSRLHLSALTRTFQLIGDLKHEGRYLLSLSGNSDLIGFRKYTRDYQLFRAGAELPLPSQVFSRQPHNHPEPRNSLVWVSDEDPDLQSLALSAATLKAGDSKVGQTAGLAQALAVSSLKAGDDPNVSWGDVIAGWAGAIPGSLGSIFSLADMMRSVQKTGHWQQEFHWIYGPHGDY
jgi:RHS repeat-associated protein